MSLKNYILQVLQTIRLCMLTQISETFSSFSFSTTFNMICIDPIVFFFLGISFPLFWMTVFDTGPYKTRSSKTSGLIEKRS